MHLSRPKEITWWIAVAFGVTGILAHLGIITVLATYAFWLVVIGFVLLVLGTLFKDI